MADIFSSYSKPNRDKIVMLAGYLESEGWTVWWDKSLTVGEPYRDEIMSELACRFIDFSDSWATSVRKAACTQWSTRRRQAIVTHMPIDRGRRCGAHV